MKNIDKYQKAHQELKDKSFLYVTNAGGQSYIRYFDYTKPKDLLLITIINDKTCVVNKRNQKIIDELMPEIENLTGIKIGEQIN